MITATATKQLTDRQREILRFVARCWTDGEVPTIRVIGSKFAISGNGARDHLNALRKKGYIEESIGRRAGARLTRKTRSLL